jgi:hypothetical protein
MELTKAEQFSAELRKIWYPEELDTASDLSPYEPDTCSRCGREMVQGDWPYCDGEMSDHITRRSSRNAQRLLTVLYENAQGRVWVPTGDNAQPPSDYMKVELTSLQQVDKYMSQLSAVEREMHEYAAESERLEWSEHIKRVRSEMNSHGTRDVPGLHSMSAQGKELYQEAMRKYEHHNPASPQPMYVEAQHFDRSNIDRG